MLRSSICALFLVILSMPAPLLAEDSLAAIEAVALANSQTQIKLQSYTATVETSRIEEMMASMTQGMPSDVAPPPTPVIKKFWQRNGKGRVFAEQSQLTPYVEKMVKQISANLAVELNEMLLPTGQTEQRRELSKEAQVKTSEVALADSRIQRLEILFKQPTDLNQAFYASGLRLPQKQVKSLLFDIDTRSNTVSEFELLTDSGLHLTVEIRYLKVEGGHIPERFKITSPDGKIDDLFEVKFTEVDGFQLPSSMLRVIHRPELQDNLEVFFKDYRVNQPVSEELQSQLEN